MKRLMIFLFPFLILFESPAYANDNLYYNQSFKYSIDFPEGWSILNEELKAQVSPEEKENTAEIFVKNYGELQLYINHHPSTHSKISLYQEILSYASNTSEKERDFSRYANKLQTELGLRVNQISPDLKKKSITLICTQTSSAFGELTEIIEWKPVSDNLVEFHFYLTDYDESVSNEVTSIINSFEISSQAKETDIKEGSFNYDENKAISPESDKYDHQKSPLWNFLMKLSNPIYWIAGAALFILWSIAYIVLKRF